MVTPALAASSSLIELSALTDRLASISATAPRASSIVVWLPLDFRLWWVSAMLAPVMSAICAHSRATAAMALLSFSVTMWVETNGSNRATRMPCCRMVSMTAWTLGLRMTAPSRCCSAITRWVSRPDDRNRRVSSTAGSISKCSAAPMMRRSTSSSGSSPL